MNLSKRIALSSTVILLFFFSTVVVFFWSNDIRKQKVNELQSTIRSQYMISDVSNELGEFNKHLLVLEAIASARGNEGVADEERQQLLTSISAIEQSLANVRATAEGSIASQLNGTSAASAIVVEWKELINWTIENNEKVQLETLTDFSADFEATNAQLQVDSAILRSRSQDLDAEIDEAVAQSSRISLTVFGISAFIALLLTFMLTRFTTRSLSALREGTKQWSDGNLEHRIRIKGKGKDDLSALARAFNGMANNLDAAMKEAQAERQKANKANKAKSGFLANMSHELRTPMNAIIGYSEMLLEEIEEEGSLEAEYAQSDLEKIRAAGKHLLALINEILDLSKIESGKMTVYYEMIDIGTLIDDVKTTVKPLVDKFDNGFEVIVDVDDPNIETDVTKFRQILMNLLSNAAKFTKEGLITVHARRFMEQGVDTISVAVKDTGIGMSKEQLDKVFDEFTQADESTTREFGGTGLGLSICRSFAILMKGRIEVESKPGKGTIFTYIAPALEHKKKTDDARGDKKGEGIEGSGLASILVIDDDDVSLEISERILSKKGFSVSTASSGAEGVAEALENHPDIIVLDVIMPGMDGWQVLDQLKENEKTRDIPIIMQSMLSERELGLAKGAADYLTKPIEKSKLTGAVRKLLPDVNMDKGLMILEEGSAIRDLISHTAEERNWDMHTTANLAEARDWLGKRQFGIVLIGKHSEMDGVSLLMKQVANLPESGRTPMLLLSSIQLEEANPDQLLSYLNVVGAGQESDE